MILMGLSYIETISSCSSPDKSCCCGEGITDYGLSNLLYAIHPPLAVAAKKYAYVFSSFLSYDDAYNLLVEGVIRRVKFSCLANDGCAKHLIMGARSHFSHYIERRKTLIYTPMPSRGKEYQILLGYDDTVHNLVSVGDEDDSIVNNTNDVCLIQCIYDSSLDIGDDGILSLELLFNVGRCDSSDYDVSLSPRYAWCNAFINAANEHGVDYRKSSTPFDIMRESVSILLSGDSIHSCFSSDGIEALKVVCGESKRA